MANIMEGSKGSQDSSQSSNVTLPDFLPGLGTFFNDILGMAGSGLSNVNQAVQGGADALVAPFTPAQQQGQRAALDIAGGAGDFLPTAQQFFLDTAAGRSPEQYMNPQAFGALSDAALGNRLGLDQFLPPEALQGLADTASGKFLEPDQGVIQAAVNQAMPGVKSLFGGTIGGLTGISAANQIGSTAIDAFNRNRQANLNRQMQAQGLLGQFGEGERARSLEGQLRAGSVLGQFGDQEAQRQFAAAQGLPGIGLLGSDIQRQIGGEQQQLEQQRLSSPLQGNAQLLAMLSQFLPIPALLGQDTTGQTSFQQFGLGFPGTA